MRSFLNALPKPIDPIVASHASSRDADRSLAALRRAGFGPADLAVVGRAGAIVDRAALATCPVTGMRRWATSGAGLGLQWAVFTCAAVLLLRSGGPALGALVALAALTLWLQAHVMRHAVNPAGGETIGPVDGSPEQASDGHARSDWRFHVVVHGSRGDVALARAILAAR